LAIFVLFFDSTGFELRASSLLDSTNWVTTPVDLFFSCFSARISWFCLGPALDHSSPNYGLLVRWDYSCLTSFPAWWLRKSLINFLPGLDSNHDPPDLLLLTSWDYRHETLPLAFPLLFLKLDI
jgi:hypothetical protein